MRNSKQNSPEHEMSLPHIQPKRRRNNKKPAKKLSVSIGNVKLIVNKGQLYDEISGKRQNIDQTDC